MNTTCLGVLHEMQDTWSVFSPWMVQNGFAHERSYVMDLRIWYGLLNACLTSVGCSLNFISYNVRNILAI